MKKVMILAVMGFILIGRVGVFAGGIPVIDSALLTQNKTDNLEQLLQLVKQLKELEEQVKTAKAQLETLDETLQIETESLQVAHEQFRIAGDPAKVIDQFLKGVEKLKTSDGVLCEDVFGKVEEQVSKETEAKNELYAKAKTLEDYHKIQKEMVNRLHRAGDSIYSAKAAEVYREKSKENKQAMETIAEEANRLATTANTATTDIEVQKKQAGLMNQVVGSVNSLAEEQRLANQLSSRVIRIEHARQQILKEKELEARRAAAVEDAVTKAMREYRLKTKYKDDGEKK